MHVYIRTNKTTLRVIRRLWGGDGRGGATKDSQRTHKRIKNMTLKRILKRTHTRIHQRTFDRTHPHTHTCLEQTNMVRCPVADRGHGAATA